MQQGWRQSPRGKALAALRQRGNSINQPVRWTTSWQSMSLEEVEAQLRKEGCSEHLIKRELGWYKELIDAEAERSDAIKVRRRVKSEIVSEEMMPYLDLMERRKERYAEVEARNKTELGTSRDRLRYFQSASDRGLDDTEGDISDGGDEEWPENSET